MGLVDRLGIVSVIASRSSSGIVISELFGGIARIARTFSAGDP